MHVFLDLWGVLLDSRKMVPGFRESLASILQSRFGGTREAWRDAHDRARTIYLREVETVDWDAREWADTLDWLDANRFLTMLAHAGVDWRPRDPRVFARQLEFEAMSAVDARYPDARPAVERLRGKGHKVYVATQATEANARGSLTGARLLECFDAVFTGHTQNALKRRVAYWETIPSSLGAMPRGCILVDDRLEYLRAAASAGFMALLLDRQDRHPPEALPPFVPGTLRNLAGLPHFVDVLHESTGS